MDVAQLQIEVDSRQVRAAVATLASLEKQGGKTESRFTSFGRTAQGLGRQLSTWLTLPILGAGAMAVKTASDYETLRTQLEVLTGSAEVAGEVFSDLTEFAATTPFEIDGIVRANNLLLGFGVSIDQTQELLRTLGDVAAVSGGDLFSMARVFGEARAEGKLLTRDLRQLIAQGVPAVQLLAESMGVAEGEIFELATAGEITFERLVAAFEMATEEGGLFFEGMSKRSNTLAGIFSNLADSVSISLGSVGQTLIDTLDIKDVTRNLIADIERATEWFNELDESAQRMIISFSLMLAAAGPVIGILGALSLAIGAISLPVTATVAAIAVGVAAMIKHWEEVEAYFTTGGGAQMWESLQGIVENTVDIITGLWDEMGDEILFITQKSFEAVLWTVETALGGINTLMQKFNGTFDDELNIFEDNIFTTLSKLDAKFIGMVKDMALGARGILSGLIDSTADLLGIIELDPDVEIDPRVRRSLEKAMLDELNREGLHDAIRRGANPFPVNVIMEPVMDLDTNLDEWENFFTGIGAGFRDFEAPEIRFPGGDRSEDIARVNDELSEQMRIIEDSARVFDDYDSGAAKIQAVESAMTSLIEAGVSPNELAMQRLILLYNQLGGEGKDNIGGLEEEASRLEEALLSASRPMEDFLSNSMQEMIWFEEQTKRVRNELGEWEEQTITLQDRMGDFFNQLLRDITRTINELLIIRPLMDSLFGEDHREGDLGGFFGSLAEGIGGYLGGESVDDALIRSDGSIVRFHPDDNILAMKDFSPIIGAQSSPSNVTVNVVNQGTDSEVDVRQRQTPGGGVDIDVMLTRKVKSMVNNGQLDRDLGQNFGLKRRGRL